MSAHKGSLTVPIQASIDRTIDDLMVSLPNPDRLLPDERRGLIARYAAVLEGNFITRFMPYLADLAARQGSAEREYTDVHGVVDIVHTEGLFRALEAEMMLLRPDVPEPTTSLFTGVETLQALIQNVIHPHGALVADGAESAAAAA